MTVEWRDAMNVGDDVIDSDHRHLVDMINDFEKAVAGQIDHKKLGRVLMGLVEYTGEHFKREEDIQLRVGYPYFESHRRSHRDVLKQLVEFVQKYTQARGHLRDDMVRGLGKFLREWLLDHIIQSDLRMKPYILKYQQAQQEAEVNRRKAIALSQRMGGLGR